ncbi:MAG: hypothetical protein IJI57_04945 [Flexilinea sp.]|nr:hypothetical protein [Flexilinea sp.]
MTREEMRKRFGALRNIEPVQKIDNSEKNEVIENDWTEEEILAAAKRHAKRLGITAPFYSGEN